MHTTTTMAPNPPHRFTVRQMAGLMVTVSGLAILVFNGNAIV